MSTETTIRKGKGISLSTAETTTALDSGAIVPMTRDEAESATASIKGRLGDLRNEIWEFEQRKGYAAMGYRDFREWAIAEIDQVSVRHAYRLLAAAETEAALGVTIGETPESHLRPLAQLDELDQRAAWDRANELAGDGPRQAAHVAQAVEELKGITIYTEGGPRNVVPICVVGELALTYCETATGRDTSRFTITHIRSGRRLADPFSSRADAEKVLEPLAALDWSQVTDMAMSVPQELAAQARFILGLPASEDTTQWVCPQCKKVQTPPMKKPGPDVICTSCANEAYEREKARYGVQAAPDARTVCRTCGQPDAQGVYYTNDCSGCYHLRLVKTRPVTDPAWHLAQARKVAERWTDEAKRSERLDEITALEAEIAAKLAAPPQQEVIEAPADEVVPERGVLLTHAESILAGMLQKVNPSELRLLHCLIMQLEIWPDDDEGIAEDLWVFGKGQLADLQSVDLAWIEAATK